MKKIISILISISVVCSMGVLPALALGEDIEITPQAAEDYCVSQTITYDMIDATNKSGIYADAEQTFTLFVSPSETAPQQILVQNDLVQIRDGVKDGSTLTWSEWRVLNNPTVQNDNAVYVVCDGNNDADKINAALGENADTNTMKRTIYLVGDCVLNASNLIDGTNEKYVIKPCSNVIFDGTYCNQLTWDGIVDVDLSIKYRMFTFKSGECGFRNLDITYINSEDEGANPEFVMQTGLTGKYIMDNMYISHMVNPNAKYSRKLVYIFGIPAYINNVTFDDLRYNNLNVLGANLKFVGKNTIFTNNTFKNCRETSSPHQLHFIELGDDAIFQNNKFDTVGTIDSKQLIIATGNRNQISGNTFYKCYGIKISSKDNSYITKNIFRSCTLAQECIMMGTWSDISQNTFISCTCGNFVIEVQNGVISDNTMINGKLADGVTDGIFITAILNSMGFAHIKDNTLVCDPQTTGLHLLAVEDANDPTLSGYENCGTSIITGNTTTGATLGYLLLSPKSIVANNIVNGESQ